MGSLKPMRHTYIYIYIYIYTYSFMSIHLLCMYIYIYIYRYRYRYRCMYNVEVLSLDFFLVSHTNRPRPSNNAFILLSAFARNYHFSLQEMFAYVCWCTARTMTKSKLNFTSSELSWQRDDVIIYFTCDIHIFFYTTLLKFNEEINGNLFFRSVLNIVW